MPHEEKPYQPDVVIDSDAPEQAGGKAKADGAIESEPDVSRSEVSPTAPEYPKPEAPPAFPAETRHIAMFVHQRWHHLYAEALLETRGKALGAKIEQAERAIQARYVELAGASHITEECRDLSDASEVLCKLKTGGTILPSSQEFVV